MTSYSLCIFQYSGTLNRFPPAQYWQINLREKKKRFLNKIRWFASWAIISKNPMCSWTAVWGEVNVNINGILGKKSNNSNNKQIGESCNRLKIKGNCLSLINLYLYLHMPIIITGYMKAFFFICFTLFLLAFVL